MRLSDEALQRLRDLSAKATPGPWFAHRIFVPNDVVAGDDALVAKVPGDHDADYIEACSPERIMELCDLVAKWHDVRAKWLSLYDGQDELAERFPALGDALCRAVHGNG